MFADDLLDLKGEALVAENEDLLEMDELHEATLLRCLENRYNKDVIYVCTTITTTILFNNRSHFMLIHIFNRPLLDPWWYHLIHSNGRSLRTKMIRWSTIFNGKRHYLMLGLLQIEHSETWSKEMVTKQCWFPGNQGQAKRRRARQ